MSTTLFRREAIDHQRAKIWGEVTLSLPTSFALTTTFLVACVVAAIAFASSGSYARKEHVGGFLASSLGIAKIMPPRAGTIVTVAVTEGQLVREGDALLTVSVEQTSDRGEHIDAAMLQTLQDQRARLREQIELQRRKAEVDRGRLQDAIAGLVAEVAALQSEFQTQTQRLEVARQQMTAIVEVVARGYISQIELKRRQDNYLSQKQTAAGLTRDITAKQGELNQQRRSLQQLPNQTAEQIAHVEQAIADVELKLREMDERRAYLLTAPIAGRVSALQAWVGKTAEPSIPQLSIVPDGAVLWAELLVPARAIGFVSVRVSYDTFPYQRFGFADGTIETVSHSLLKPDEVVGPVVLRELSYRVGVALRRQAITAFGKPIPLQADMQLQADILFDRRSLLQWLLDPVLSAWRGSQ